MIVTHLGERLVAGRHHQVATDHRVGFTGRNTGRVNLLGTVGDAHMRPHRTALLASPAMSRIDTPFALEMGGHAQQRTDGHHAGTADAGDENAPRRGRARQLRLGQFAERIGRRASGLAPLRSLPPSTVTKLGQNP